MRSSSLPSPKHTPPASSSTGLSPAAFEPYVFLDCALCLHPCCPAAFNHFLCLLPCSAPINYPHCSRVIFLKCKSDPAAPLDFKAFVPSVSSMHASVSWPPRPPGVLLLLPHLSPLLALHFTLWPHQVASGSGPLRAGLSLEDALFFLESPSHFLCLGNSYTSLWLSFDVTCSFLRRVPLCVPTTPGHFCALQSS